MDVRVEANLLGHPLAAYKSHNLTSFARTHRFRDIRISKLVTLKI